MEQYAISKMSFCSPFSKIWLEANYSYSAEMWFGLVTEVLFPPRLFSFFFFWVVMTTNFSCTATVMNPPGAVSHYHLAESGCRHPSLLIIPMTAPFKPKTCPHQLPPRHTHTHSHSSPCSCHLPLWSVAFGGQSAIYFACRHTVNSVSIRFKPKDLRDL